MDLDYHFGTVYVLSRWADFGSFNARTIAAASQLVDDNFDSTPFSDTEEEKNIARGIQVRYSCQNVWGNISGKGNEDIWIPFHFLPGLQGQTEAEKLVCKKHSVMAKRLKYRLYDTTLANSNYVFRLGVGMHVLADTWAHQEFAGINNAVNQVKDLLFSTQGSMVEKMLDEMLDSTMLSKILDMVMPLGHAAAVHCPDMPYLWWKSGERFTGGRKNWDEFMDASDELYAVLQHVSGVPETGLTMEQRNKLSECFKGFQSENINRRYGFWIDRIRENFFEFEDFNEDDRNVEYSIGLILDDLNWRKQFYDEINDHFFWVKEKLEENGINRLGKKYKGY